MLDILVAQITADLPPGFRVLDAGCGTGNVLSILEGTCSRGVVIGLDPFAEALHHARRHTSSHLIQGDIHTAPFRRQFDLICLLDVLEHLPNDAAALIDLYGMLSQNGVLLLTVPAHRSLWSYFDEASHHYRRYELPEVRSKLTSAGYRVEYATQFMACIYPLVRLGRRLRSLGRQHAVPDAEGAKALACAEFRIIPGVNSLLALLLSLEVPLIARRQRLPIGTSLLVLARKDTAAQT